MDLEEKMDSLMSEENTEVQVLKAISLWEKTQGNEIQVKMLESLMLKIDMFEEEVMEEVKTTGSANDQRKTINVRVDNNSPEGTALENDRSEEFYRYALGLCQEKFGKLGAFKLLVEYRVSCNRSDATVFDILKSFEKIENTTESLQDLQDKLTKVGLLRASSVISQYIELQEFKTKCLNLEMRDWEIYAIEIFKISKEDVLRITDIFISAKDQVTEVLKLWQKGCPHGKSEMLSKYQDFFIANETDRKDVCKQLKHKEHFFNNFGSGKSGEDIPLANKSKDDSPHSDRQKFTAVIGPEGSKRLWEKYEKETRGYTPTEFAYGAKLLEELKKHKLLDQSDIDSLSDLAAKLNDCCLFRAYRVVEELVVNRVKPTLQRFRTKVDLDWEIFAVESLQISKEAIIQVIKNNESVTAQVDAVFYQWFWNLPVKAIYEKKLDGLMSASKVCEESDVNGATINVSEHLQKVEEELKESLRHLYDAKEKQDGLPEDAFVEMLISIGSLIGRTGSTRVLEKYEMHKSDLQTIANEKHSLGTGYKMIGILLNKNTLRNDKKGLEEFREKLEVASLFRAMEMINKFTKANPNVIAEENWSKADNSFSFDATHFA